MRYRLAAGVRVEPLETAWAAYGALSGDTLLLNTEGAAVLELLAEGPADPAKMANILARDTETDVAAISEALRHVWDQLVSAGLIEWDDTPEHNSG